jgi:hypothetical protein
LGSVPVTISVGVQIATTQSIYKCCKKAECPEFIKRINLYFQLK